MQIRIEFFAQAAAVAGSTEISVEIQEGGHVLHAVEAAMDCKELSSKQEADLRELLLTPQGKLHSWILASVNGIGVHNPSAHILSPGDALYLLPPISGG
jgi:molybdopterin converting factor small subunit